MDSQLTTFYRTKSKWSQAISLLFLISAISFPRSFVEIKMALLGLLIIDLSSKLFFSRRAVLPRPILIFYGTIMAMGVIWSLIGVLQNNPSQAIVQGARLYIAWSFLIPMVLMHLFLNDPMKIIHLATILSGIVTSVIVLSFVLSSWLHRSIYPDWFVKEMILRIGFHDGYVQITSHNIGTLLFIVPYLLVSILRSDNQEGHRWLMYVSLFLCMITVVFSGRRALWLIVALMPALSFLASMITGTTSRNRHYKKILILFFAGVIGFVWTSAQFIRSDAIAYIYTAFSAEDERSIQAIYLINSFSDLPLLGSGFGGLAGYIRSDTSPWLYELTYYQLLFNFGLVGSAIFILLFGIVIQGVLANIRSKDASSCGLHATLLGVFGVLIGAHSNPYLGSFDYLIILSFLPLMASIKGRADPTDYLCNKAHSGT